MLLPQPSKSFFLNKALTGCFLFGLDSGVSWEAGPAQKGSRTVAAPSPPVVEAQFPT